LFSNLSIGAAWAKPLSTFKRGIAQLMSNIMFNQKILTPDDSYASDSHSPLENTEQATLQRSISLISAEFEKTTLLTALNFLATALSDSDLSIAQIQFLEKNQVLFSSYGRQIQVNYLTHASHKSTGIIKISGKQFTDYVKQLPNESIFLSVDNEQRVCLKCGKSSAKMQMLRDNSHGNISIPPTGVELKISPEPLSRWIDSFKEFVLVEDPRFYSNASLVWIQDSQLHSVTTDAHRLAKVYLENGFEILKNNNSKILIPKKILDEMKRICSLNSKKDITLKWSSEHAAIVIEFENYVMRASCSVGAYPPYESAIPKNIKTEIKLPLKLFQDSVKRVMLFADDKKLIHLKFHSQEMFLASDTQGVKEGEERVPIISPILQDFMVCFNIIQLNQVLSAMSGTEVCFYWDDIEKPTMLKYDSDKDLNIFYLLVPVRM
jgi:DNA polymerase III beta subunit